MSAVESWFVNNAGAILGTAAVEYFLLGAGWMELGVTSLANAYWQGWYANNQPSSSAPYITLVSAVLPIAVPTAALYYLLDVPVPVGAMISMGGYIGHSVQSGVVYDLAQIKTDLTPASS
jgi:beta-galactosidase GanA